MSPPRCGLLKWLPEAGWGTCFEPCSFANPARRCAYCSAGRGFGARRLRARGTARTAAGTGAGASHDVAASVTGWHAGARLAARHRDEKRLRRPRQSGSGGGSKTPFHPGSVAAVIASLGASSCEERKRRSNPPFEGPLRGHLKLTGKFTRKPLHSSASCSKHSPCIILIIATACCTPKLSISRHSPRRSARRSIAIRPRPSSGITGCLPTPSPMSRRWSATP